MLIFPLKKEWYEKIKSGEKTIEYREVKPFWTTRFYNELGFFPEQCPKGFDFPRRDCFLGLGYTGKYLYAIITKIEIVDGKGTDLCIDAPVYAIHLCDVREVQ